MLTSKASGDGESANDVAPLIQKHRHHFPLPNHFPYHTQQGSHAHPFVSKLIPLIQHSEWVAIPSIWGCGPDWEALTPSGKGGGDNASGTQSHGQTSASTCSPATGSRGSEESKAFGTVGRRSSGSRGRHAN